MDSGGKMSAQKISVKNYMSYKIDVRVVERFDHVTRFIVNANHRVTGIFGSKIALLCLMEVSMIALLENKSYENHNRLHSNFGGSLPWDVSCRAKELPRLRSFLGTEQL